MIEKPSISMWPKLLLSAALLAVLLPVGVLFMPDIFTYSDRI